MNFEFTNWLVETPEVFGRNKSVAPMGLLTNICHVILPTLNADGIKYRVLSSVKSARLVENKSSCIGSSVGTKEKKATKNLPNTYDGDTNQGADC